MAPLNFADYRDAGLRRVVGWRFAYAAEGRPGLRTGSMTHVCAEEQCHGVLAAR